MQNVEHLYPTIYTANSMRGAPIGRAAWTEAPEGPVTLRKLPINSGGYDPGGAYYGTPDNVYYATDGHNFRYFVRADNSHLAAARIRTASGFAGEFQRDTLTELLGGYVEAMLHTERVDTEGNDESSFRDHGYDISSLTPEALEKARAICAEFLQKAGELNLRDAPLDDAGRNIWYDAQGHGSGFHEDPPSKWGGYMIAHHLFTAAEGLPEIQEVYLNDNEEIEIR